MSEIKQEMIKKLKCFFGWHEFRQGLNYYRFWKVCKHCGKIEGVRDEGSRTI